MMGNGFCLYGRDPVFADVDAYTDRLDADEARAEAVDAHIDDAVDDMLAGQMAWSLLADVACENASIKLQPLHAIYNRDTGECRADVQDDWQRVMLYADPKHLPMLQVQWRDWVRAKAANYREVIEHAERLADESERDYADSVAAERGEARGEL